VLVTFNYRGLRDDLAGTLGINHAALAMRFEAGLDAALSSSPISRSSPSRPSLNIRR
jgi:hypothetical protein